MKTLSPGLWLPGAIVLTALWFFAATDLSAQTVKSPCQCADVPDLINLLNMDNAVREGLEEYQKTIKASDMVNEVLPEPNPNKLTKGDNLLSVIKQQVDWVKDKEANVASAEMDNASCQPKNVQAETDCLKHILGERTDLNSGYCRKYKLDNKLGEKEDTLNFMPLSYYLTQQRALYEREVQKILQILNGMSPACRPKDWFGIITVYEDITNNVTLEAETMEDSTIRAGTVRFNGKSVGQQLSFWQVAGKYKNTKFGKEGKRDCTGGFATAKPDTKYRTSFTIEVSKNGGGTFPITIDFGEPDDTNILLIGIQIPQMIVKWDFSSVSKRESGCPNDSLKETNLYTTDFPLDSEFLNFGAKFALGKTKFEPSQNIIAAGPVQNFSNETSGTKLSHTHRVTVFLYKL